MKKSSFAKVAVITCTPMILNNATYKFAVIFNAAIDTNDYLAYAGHQLRKMGYCPVDCVASEPMPLAIARGVAWNNGMLCDAETLSDPDTDFDFSYLTMNDFAGAVG